MPIPKTPTVRTIRGTDLSIGVVGRGQMGSALMDRLGSVGYQVEWFGRDFDPEEVLQKNIVFLAVPQGEVSGIGATLKKSNAAHATILVEMSNSQVEERVAEYLQKTLPHCSVVKAFTTVSAFDLIYRTERLVTIAGNDDKANRKVGEVATTLGLHTQIIGHLDLSYIVESAPLTLFKGWGRAAVLVGGIWAFTFIYAYQRYFGPDYYACCGKHPISKLPLWVMNKTVSWSSLWVFAWVYGLGGVAELKAKPLSDFMVNLLSIRKQVSVLGFFLLLLHGLISVCIFSPGYYGKFYDGDILLGRISLSMLLGMLGFGVFCLVALASVPAVGEKLSWREWTYLQRWFGLAALVLGTAHVMVMGVPGWGNLFAYTEKGHWGMPGITFVSSAPAALVVLFRSVVFLLPDGMRPKSRKLQTGTWFAVEMAGDMEMELSGKQLDRPLIDTEG